MPQIEFNNGQEPLAFTEFPLVEQNARKINMVRGGKESEGVWAAFDEVGLAQYDGNARTDGYAAVCILMNPPLHFYPNNLWGVYMPVKFNGEGRPTVDIDDLDGSPVFSQEAIKAQTMRTTAQQTEHEGVMKITSRPGDEPAP